jgi:hypothetical protein
MYIKIGFIGLLALGILNLTTSCNKVKGDGNVIQKDYETANFEVLESPINAKITYQHAATSSIKLQGDSNLIAAIDYWVSDKKLSFSYKKNHTSFDKAINIVIYTPELKSVDIKGSGSVVIPTLEVASFDIKTSGSSNIVIGNITAENLEIDLSGSGNTTIESGTINQAEIKIQGSGNVDKVNAITQHTNVKIVGSGYLKTNTTLTLKAKITGSGDVYYKNSPTIDIDITGSGKFKHLD